MHVVCKWIGNSQRVAAQHYLQLTDEHFDRAIRDEQEAGRAEAAQNAAQQPAETSRNAMNVDRQRDSQPAEDSEACAIFPLGSEPCESEGMTGVGLEPTTSGLKGRCSTD